MERIKVMLYYYLLHLSPMKVLACYVIVLACYYALRKNKIEDKRFYIIVVLYYSMVISCTILGRDSVEKVGFVNLWLTYQQAICGDVSSIYEIVLNILLFIPMGLIEYTYNRSLLKTIIWCVAVSVIIESVQLITGRGVFEVSDIVNNSVGGCVGAYLLFMMRGKR